MDTTHNTSKIEDNKKVQEKISEFEIKDTSNLIVSIINAPVGKIAIKSSVIVLDKDNKEVSSFGLGHASFTGTPEEILTMLLKACATVLLKGKDKNPQPEKNIIIPSRDIVVPQDVSKGGLI